MNLKAFHIPAEEPLKTQLAVVVLVNKCVLVKDEVEL